MDGDVVVDEWEAAAGEEFQAIRGVEGVTGDDLTIEGVLEVGEYIGILEVRGNLSFGVFRAWVVDLNA